MSKKEREIVESLKTAFDASKKSVDNNKDRLAYISGYISEKHPELSQVLFDIHFNIRWS